MADSALPPAQPIHATSVARRTAGGWTGVLLTGPSGSGKSDLALRLIARGWRLVADDYSLVWASGSGIYAAAPPTIAGRMEVRGVGIVGAPAVRLARIVLVAACRLSEVERMPERACETIAGVALPRLAVDVRPASAPDVVEAAVTAHLSAL